MIDISAENVALWSRISSRKTFGLVLDELACEHPELMVLVADVADSAGLGDFEKNHPDQFLNVGIAEQNMTAIAAGLAKSGYQVFAVSFAPFASMRCFEVLRTYLGYMNLNVTVVGIASGLSMGTAGNTHYGLEDLALARTIPNMTVVSPADCTETAKAVEALLEHKGPAYLRLMGVNGNQPVYKENYDFRLGRATKVREGTDVAIVATGTMVYESLRATRKLQKDGISCTIIDMSTVKPLDEEILEEVFDLHRLVVTIEEHTVIGGLGSAVAEYKARYNKDTRLEMMGLPDSFGKAGTYAWLLDYHKLSARHIADRITDAYKKLD